MDKFTPYALNALPTTEIDPKGFYLIKTSATRFNIYVRNNDNSDWIFLGIADALDKVNGLTGDVKIDLQFSGGVLKVVATGTGTPVAVTSINLHNTYVQIANVVDNFASTSATRPASANTVKQLKDLYDSLLNLVNEGVRVPEPIDCSSNPNYPASTAGDQYRVTVAGRIGGASGPLVEVNDIITCFTDSAGGTHEAVGSDFYITQSNVDAATETVRGLIRLATQLEVDEGENNDAAVTPNTLYKVLNDALFALEGIYIQEVKVNGNNLTKTNGEVEIPIFSGVLGSNIGLVPPAPSSGFYHLSRNGNWLSAMTQTYLDDNNTTPRLISADLLNSQIDAKVEAATAWGGVNGKEW